MKELLQGTSDMVLGSVVLVLFVAFCIGLGKIIATFKNARYAKAWEPLVPIINGTVHDDGGGASTSWLVGTWQGRRVQAIMAPNRNRYSGESGSTFHEFGVELLDVPGAQDWRIEFEEGVPLFSQPAWKIHTPDPALRQRLEAAGALLLLEAFGTPTVSYSRSQKRISYLGDAGSRWTPTPEHFQAELDLLLRLARVNEEVNPPYTA